MEQHLEDVDYGEERERGEHDEVDGACEIIPSKERSEVRQLDWLVHGEAGEHEEWRHDEYTRVS